MSTLAKTYTFTSGTTAVAAEVNTNFDDIVSYVNTNSITKDGALAMTAALSLVDAEPSGSNVALRRKSGYRSCLNSHPSADVFTVGAGSATSLTTMLSASNMMGYTPDYEYSLLVLLTGTILLTGNLGTGVLSVTDAADAEMNLFGPQPDGGAQYTAGNNNVYMGISHVGLKQNIAASTLPAYKVKYKVAGITVAHIWGVALSWILPTTRQLPN